MRLILLKYSKKIFTRLKKLPFFYYEYKNDANIITIIPHQGLGDLVVLFNALVFLCERHEIVYIACPKKNFDHLTTVLHFPSNLKLIRYKNIKLDWVINSKYLLVYKKYSEKIIKLGYFNNDPIYDYPNSFYKSLGVPFELIHSKLNFRRINVQKPFDKYIYCNLNTSTVNFELSNIDSTYNIIEYIDQQTLSFNKKLINIEKTKSLALNLELALMADQIYCSDAGFFNLLNYCEKLPRIHLYTRYTYYKHNKNLYRCIFDGEEKEYI